MTKRYIEAVEVETVDDGGDAHAPPASFTWRGGCYRVLTVLGHWREDAAYWSGGGVEVPQRDLWRVEAHRARAAAGGHHGPGAGASARVSVRAAPGPPDDTPARGIYELVAEGDRWRLDRIWD